MYDYDKINKKMDEKMPKGEPKKEVYRLFAFSTAYLSYEWNDMDWSQGISNFGMVLNHRIWVIFFSKCYCI